MDLSKYNPNKGKQEIQKSKASGRFASPPNL